MSAYVPVVPEMDVNSGYPDLVTKRGKHVQTKYFQIRLLQEEQSDLELFVCFLQQVFIKTRID